MVQEQTLEEIKRLYAEGMTIYDVGEELGMHSSTVYGHLKKAGVEIRGYGMRHQDPGEEVLRRLYWDDELSQRKISERFGVCTQTVSYWMQNHGVETRHDRSLHNQLLEMSPDDKAPKNPREVDLWE